MNIRLGEKTSMKHIWRVDVRCKRETTLTKTLNRLWTRKKCMTQLGNCKCFIKTGKYNEKVLMIKDEDQEVNRDRSAFRRWLSFTSCESLGKPRICNFSEAQFLHLTKGNSVLPSGKMYCLNKIYIFVIYKAVCRRELLSHKKSINYLFCHVSMLKTNHQHYVSRDDTGYQLFPVG